MDQPAKQPENPAAAERATLPNRKTGFEHLRRAGYKISQGKFYQDCDRGLVKLNSDGTLDQAEVEAYIVRAGLKIKEDRRKDLDKSAVKKAQATLDGILIDNKRKQLELDKLAGELIRKSDVVVEFAGRLVAIEAGLKHTVRSFAPDWLTATGGDPKKADLLTDLVFAEIDRLLTEIANLEEIGIQVQFAQSAESTAGAAGEDGE